MRREWGDAFAVIHRPAPLTPDIWILWAVLTVPMGVAIVAYAATPILSAAAKTVYASVTLWLLMTAGMAIWGRRASLPSRVIALDVLVNLVVMLLASLAAVWSLG